MEARARANLKFARTCLSSELTQLQITRNLYYSILNVNTETNLAYSGCRTWRGFSS